MIMNINVRLLSFLFFYLITIVILCILPSLSYTSNYSINNNSNIDESYHDNRSRRLLTASSVPSSSSLTTTDSTSTTQVANTITNTEHHKHNTIHRDIVHHQQQHHQHYHQTSPFSTTSTSTTNPIANITRTKQFINKIFYGDLQKYSNCYSHTTTISIDTSTTRCKDKRLLYLAFSNNIDNDVLIAEAKVLNNVQRISDDDDSCDDD